MRPGRSYGPPSDNDLQVSNDQQVSGFWAGAESTDGGRTNAGVLVAAMAFQRGMTFLTCAAQATGTSRMGSPNWP